MSYMPMSFRLVRKWVTSDDLERRNSRYFTEFRKPVFQHITVSTCGGIYARVYCIVGIVRIRCRRKESSGSLSHLLASFLFSTLR